MKRITILVAVAAVSLITTACTDTQRAHLGAYGDSARVTCFSGGKLIFDDFSTGKVANADGSDGYEFKSASNGRLTQASGDCQIDYGATKPAGFKSTHRGEVAA